MLRSFQDLTGKSFGYLTVVGYAGTVPVGKLTQSAWHCDCKCGKQTTVLQQSLKKGHTRSCGCLHKEIVSKRKIDLVGEVFGLLTVVEFIRMYNGSSIWLCRCECGETCEASANVLRRKEKKSCGCKQGWWRSSQPGLWKDAAAYYRWKRQDPLRKLRHGVSGSIRGMIKHNGSYKRKKSIRNYLPYTIEELKIHLESLWEPWMNWDNYGGRSNSKERTWWIDHKIPHSHFPYTSMDDPLFSECWRLENLQPLEKKANMSKGTKLIDDTRLSDDMHGLH